MEQPVPMRPPQELVGFAETYKRGAIEKLVEHRAIDAEFKRTLGLLEQDGFEHRRCDASPWGAFEGQVRTYFGTHPSQALTPAQVAMVRLAFDLADIRVPR